ncbi:rubisco activase [Actinidia rufa]|uniref:Rubisco activase n=1 Tax=Actinidia rufa TaxID=165716 RepID=A0A7J0H9R4_9ERIC|nr:rubisco activase [Actinidia rufa]
MASTVQAVNRKPLSLNSSNSGGYVPSSAFLGGGLKKVVSSRYTCSKTLSLKFKIKAAEINEEKQTDKDRWRGLAYDISTTSRTSPEEKEWLILYSKLHRAKFRLMDLKYREAADIIRKGKMCCLFINDLDAGVGNDFSTLYAPLIRDGRMEKFYWAPTRENRIGVCTGIFRTDNVPPEEVVKLVDTFPGQSIGVGVDSIGKKLVNSKEGPPTFEQPKMTLESFLSMETCLSKNKKM